MPITNLTVQDTSPWLTYGGAWKEFIQATGPEFPDLVEDSHFHFTKQANANVSLTFTGTGVWVHGTRRSGHGSYVASVDGHTPGPFNAGISNNASQANATLFSSGILPFQQHTFFLANTQDTFSFNFLTLEVGDGNANTQSIVSTMDDVHPNITYDSHWAARLDDSGSTTHGSDVSNSVAQVSFYGNAIELYGPTSSKHGSFSVSLDGGSATRYAGGAGPNIANPLNNTQQLLYFANNLSAGMHTVSLTNLEDGLYTDLDYAVATVYETSSTSNGPLSASPAPTSAPGSAKGQLVAITAGVIGGIVMVAVLLVTVVLIKRRRRRPNRHHKMSGGSEVDMPPPNYNHVFTSGRAEILNTTSAPSDPEAQVWTAESITYVPTLGPGADRKLGGWELDREQRISVVTTVIDQKGTKEKSG